MLKNHGRMKGLWLIPMLSSFVILGLISFFYLLKPLDLSWSKMDFSLLLILGASSLVTITLLPFRESKFLTKNFYAAVVSATWSAGLIGLVLIFVSKVFDLQP